MNNMIEALERIAAYPRSRSEEMSIGTAREIARAALASQAQQTESQWISVDERLPEENTYVLCSYKRFGEWLVHEGRYNEKGDFTITIIDAKVRYWMPLPPAPEGDKP